MLNRYCWFFTLWGQHNWYYHKDGLYRQKCPWVWCRLSDGISIWNPQFIPLCTGQEDTGKSRTPLWSRGWLAQKVIENTSWIPLCFLVTDACTWARGQWNLWMWHHLFCWSGGAFAARKHLVVGSHLSTQVTEQHHRPTLTTKNFLQLSLYKPLLLLPKQCKLNFIPTLFWYMDLSAWIKAEPFLLLQPNTCLVMVQSIQSQRVAIWWVNAQCSQELKYLLFDHDISCIKCCGKKQNKTKQNL